VPFVRFNSEDIEEMRFTLEVSPDGSSRRLISRSRTVDFADIGAVWFRRQLQSSANWIAADDRSFAATELRHYLDSFVMQHSARWINSPAATFRAERKLFVLERARALGIRAPHTVATNDVESFRRRPAANWIVKPIYQGLHSSNGSLRALYTQRLSDFREVTDDEIGAVPCILQEEIIRGRDLRVTCVGPRTFGATVVADTIQQVDWRRPESNARFEPTKISDEISRWCHLLMEDLGLAYGAFDFIEDREGKSWFLEVNPAGEFAWLEVQLGLPIRDALIDVFEEQST
jgi:glutathione synthase/RimK-type ligase-like ATP-grasp enzyme